MILTLIVLVICILAIFFSNKFNQHIKDTAALEILRNSILIILITFIAISGIANIVSYNICLDYQADLQVIENKINISNTRSLEIIDQIKVEVSKYKEYEKGIFDEIKPSNINLLIFKYPELRTVEAIKVLIDEIAKLNNLTYEIKLRREDLKSRLISANKNVFIWWTFKYDLGNE